MKVSEVYMRAVKVALNRKLNAKGVVCTFMVGKYEFTFNGTDKPVGALDPLMLQIAEPGAFLPVMLCSARSGIMAGDLGIENAVLKLLRPETPELDEVPPPTVEQLNMRFP